MEYKLPKLPERPQNSNKGTFGKILNIAGSEYMSGAAYLSSVSALKIGAGYVELASDNKTLDRVAKLAPEIVLKPLNKLSEIIKDVNIISIGCGLSTSIEAKLSLHKTITIRKNQPLVIDADGLNILSKTKYTFNNDAILTPHPKEASRLLNKELQTVLNNIEQSAIEISKKYNCITVLKSHNTVVTDGNNIYTNHTGCSALAKAGSGDVLCGIITGLLAQGMNLFDAAALGVHLHGLAGDIAAKNLTEYSVLASDLVRYIPFAVKNYTT